MIYQALFGDKDGGYALLDTNHPERLKVERICNSTDLLSRPAAGSSWNSSVRGFPVGDHYVVMKTYLDNSPGVRYGRVFTHAGIVNLKDLAKIDIERLFELFPLNLEKNVNLESDVTRSNVVGSEEIQPNRLQKVWRGFIEGKIVVWLGDQDFQLAISKLWASMPPRFRENFAFEISFSPSQLNLRGKFTLINSPESLHSKWENDSKFCVIGSNESAFQSSEIESYLLGDGHSSDFRTFIAELKLSIESFEMLKALVAIYKSFKTINDCDFHRANNALQLSLKYLPRDPGGKAIAEVFFVRMLVLISDTNSGVITGIRKLKCDQHMVGDFEGRVTAALHGWCASKMFNREKNKADQIYSLISSLNFNDNESWWKGTINSYIEKEFLNWSEEKSIVLAIWLGSEKGLEVFNVLVPFIKGNQRTIELETAQVVGSLATKNLAVPLMNRFLEQGMYVFHAALVLVVHEPEDAIAVQLLVEKTSMDSLPFLKSKLGNREFLTQSLLDRRDTRLLKLCSEAIVEEPQLAKQLDVNIRFDQDIIYRLMLGSQMEKYFDDVTLRILFPLLDRLHSGESNEAVKCILALPTQSNLLHYQNRKTIWGLLENINRSFLSNTARKYLENLEALNSDELEPPLRKEILASDNLAWYLNINKRQLSRALDLMENFPEIAERTLQDFLYFFNTEISSLESKRLGELIATRGYKVCAGIVLSKCESSLSSFRVALNLCSEELSLFDSIKATIMGYANNGKVKSDDCWNGLLEIACKLFPEGPKQNKLWKQAGGDNSDLLHNDTGKNIWRDALQQLKSGGLTEITAKSLINKMLDSYPKNHQLKFLKKIDKEVWSE